MMYEQPPDGGYPMRAPCKLCGCETGILRTVSGQDTVRCAGCGKHQYNAPKVETGREARTVSTVHEGISAKKRARILTRANLHCELCGVNGTTLHVAHLLSVKKGLSLGLTEFELNSDENLAAMCEECNLGLGDEPVPIRLCISILKARLRNEGKSFPEAG